MPRQPGEKPIHAGFGLTGQWQWADGTRLNGDEEREFNLTAAGDAGNIGQQAGGDSIGNAIGFNPTLANENAPGAKLDTQAADANRMQIGELLASLQQQAATGDGSWQGALDEGTRRTQATAAALGQSDPTESAGLAGYDIANAKGAAAQRAVGTGDKLRTQAKIDAQDQMSDILGRQASGDIAQSAEEQRVQRQRALANQASIDQTGKNREGVENGITGVFKMGMSDGGKVPGKPEVFGDSEANDTVPAKLSPGEVVLPRSISHDPQAAANFVAALNAGRNPTAALDASGAQHLADGGESGVGIGSAVDIGNDGGYLGYFGVLPQVGRTIQYDAMRKKYGSGSGSGGTLDTSQINQTRNQQQALNTLYGQRAQGIGPSLSGSMIQEGTDDAIGRAMAARQGGAPMANSLGRAVASGQQAGAAAAAQRGNEQSQGQNMLAGTLGQQRGQAMQFASAQQQAAWEKTLSDMGLSLDARAHMRGAISGAGQAAAAFSALGKGDNAGPGGGDPYGDASSMQNGRQDGESGWADDSAGGGDTSGDSMMGDGSGDGGGDSGDGGGGDGWALGGVIPSYAKGGKVSPSLLAAIEHGRKAKPAPAPERKLGTTPQPVLDALLSPNPEPSQDFEMYDPAKTMSVSAAHPGQSTIWPEYTDMQISAAAPVVRSDTPYWYSSQSPTITPERQAAAAELRSTVDAARLANDELQRQYEEEGGEGVRPPPGKKPPGPPPKLASRNMAMGGDTAGVGFGPAIQSTGPMMADPNDPAMYEPVRYGRSALPFGAAQAVATQLEQPAAPGGRPIVPIQAMAPGSMGGPPTSGPTGGNLLGPADYALRTTPGLALKTQASSVELPPPVVAPQSQPGRQASGVAGSGLGMPRPEDRSENDKLTESAINTGADLEAQAARAQAVGEAERFKVGQEYAAREATTRARAKQEVDGAFTRLQAAQDEMNRIDTNVDPGRFWASRTTDQKVIGIIGLALGAMGTGPDGINRAAELMNKAIDRDIDAQKSEYEMRLKKGTARVSAAQTYYGMAREAGLDAVAAEQAAKAAAYDGLAHKTEMTIAAIKEPMARNKGQALIAAARNAATEKREKSKELAFNERIQLEDLGLKKEALEIQRNAADKKGGLPPDARKVVAEVQEREANIQRNARELDSLIEQYGTQEKLAPGIEARMNQLRSALVVDSAKMKDPGGVVREPDEEREGRALGFEPGFWQRSANSRAAIKAFAQGAEARKRETLKAWGVAQ